MSFAIQVTFDCADPAALSRFWNEVLGYRLDSPPPPYESWDEALEAFGVPEENRNDASACVDPDGQGPRLFFQKVPEGKSAKNRVHVDVRAAPGLRGEDRMAALEERCEALLALGATRVARHEADAMGLGHIVMQDPEGNEFCLD
jgi:catechol 2,3-dioxygenase-like lactoylglutathione lyase family enzyme